MVEDKDCIFYINELKEDDFEYIYITIDFIKEGRKHLDLIPKKYYIYVVYLLEKEIPINAIKKTNINNSIAFLKEMIDAEKLIYKLDKKDEEIIQKNIEELDKYVVEFQNNTEIDIDFDIFEDEEEKEKIFAHLEVDNRRREKEYEEFWEQVKKDLPNRIWNKK